MHLTVALTITFLYEVEPAVWGRVGPALQLQPHGRLSPRAAGMQKKSTLLDKNLAG